MHTILFTVLMYCTIVSSTQCAHYCRRLTYTLSTGTSLCVCAKVVANLNKLARCKNYDRHHAASTVFSSFQITYIFRPLTS
jgi:hypothetical protein